MYYLVSVNGFGSTQLKTSVNRVHSRCVSVKAIYVNVNTNVDVVFWPNTVVFGPNTVLFGPNTVVFGPNTVVFGTNTVVFGKKCTGILENTVVFGTNKVVFWTNTVVFGT